MANQQPQAPQKVAPRNDLKNTVLRRNSRATELSGQDKNFVYRYFSTDPAHPDYYGKRVVEHERGNDAIGYVDVGAWEVVQRKAGGPAPVDPRTDQGKPIDSAIRHGTQILCRLPKDEYAKYEMIESLQNKRLAASLYGAERRQLNDVASITTVVSDREDVDPMEMLQNARNGNG